MPSDKRDIGADRKEFDRVCETPDWNSYADFVSETLPHYLDRCEEDEQDNAEAATLLLYLEAALAAAIERLASVLCVYPLSLPRTCNGRCHDCWRSWLEQQGKEGAKNHA